MPVNITHIQRLTLNNLTVKMTHDKFKKSSGILDVTNGETSHLGDMFLIC
jgi:hypothetical protein